MFLKSRKHFSISFEGFAACVKAAICVISFIQFAPKLVPCFWHIFTDFQNEGFSSRLKYLSEKGTTLAESTLRKNNMMLFFCIVLELT